LDLESDTTSWYPVNALDTTLFTSIEPYSRDEIKTKEDIVRLLLIRATTFLGYSNSFDAVSTDEIEKMATLESEAIIRVVKDNVIRQSLSRLDIKSILDSEGVINGVSRKITSVTPETKIGTATIPSSSKYDYIFLPKSNGWRILPINKGFNNFNWGGPNRNNYVKLIDLRDNEGYIFTSNFKELGSSDLKQDDGSTYVKILDPNNIPNKPTLINEVEVSEYTVHPSPLRSPIFDAGKTSRINVADFMVSLLKDKELWEKWKYKTPVIYNLVSKK
jgi:hypothetical protein